MSKAGEIRHYNRTRKWARELGWKLEPKDDWTLTMKDDEGDFCFETLDEVDAFLFGFEKGAIER